MNLVTIDYYESVYQRGVRPIDQRQQINSVEDSNDAATHDDSVEDSDDAATFAQILRPADGKIFQFQYFFLLMLFLFYRLRYISFAKRFKL